jgi:tetratricopeptide (TPR) repeat protein
LLDKLASDETNDVTLLVELADAYTKLAAIQNWSFREFDKSLENLQKAKPIYQTILQTEPDNIKIRRSLYATQMRLAELFRETKRRDELFRIYQEAIENQRELFRIEPQSATHLANLSAVHGGFGDIHSSYDEKDAAVENYRKGIELIDQAIELQKSQGNSPKTSAEIPRFHTNKGWLQIGIGDSAKAIENYRISAELAANAYLQDPTIVDNFLRVVGSYEKIGVIYEGENNFEAALESYLKGKDQATFGLKNKNLPNPAEIQDYECFFTVQAARMFDKLGDKNYTRQYFTEGENLCRQTLKQNPDRIESLHEELERFYAISDFYFANGERERSITLLTEIAGRLETVIDKNEWDLGTAFALADTFEKIGDHKTGSQSLEFYKKSHEIWAKYKENYSLLPAEFEKMEAVRKKLKID